MSAVPSQKKSSTDRSRATEPSSKQPLQGMPDMVELEEHLVPQAAGHLEELDVEPQILANLAVKLANTTPQFTSEWAAQRLRLPLQIVEQIYYQLKQDRMVEVLGQEGVFNYRYAITELGRKFATRLIEISGYVGPAPVSLRAYTEMLRWVADRQPPVTLEDVQSALSDLVIPENAVRVSALAAASGRSLFLFGPAGNGKTTIGQCLHRVLHGYLWLPHCVAVDNTIIRIFDPSCHKSYDEQPLRGKFDQRWVRVHRPLLVAGGEMTMEELDLIYNPALRFYESPPHVKANGGTFLIDDFGRQRMQPEELLNRWIVPLERRIDFLTLNTGQKIEIPFELMLTVATNLTVEDVADPAFLRRMGYRLHLDRPTPDAYREIFVRYARRLGTEAQDDVVTQLISRYEREGRDLRSSEPKDLIERARDICALYERPFELTTEMLDLAWDGYFGNMAAVEV